MNAASDGIIVELRGKTPGVVITVPSGRGWFMSFIQAKERIKAQPRLQAKRSKPDKTCRHYCGVLSLLDGARGTLLLVWEPLAELRDDDAPALLRR